MKLKLPMMTKIKILKRNMKLKVCNHMRRRDIMLHLIKWRGYKNPTWEPEDVMRTSINDDVETYWEKLKNQNVRILLRKKVKSMTS